LSPLSPVTKEWTGGGFREEEEEEEEETLRKA
jgi:hypothetical protein